MAGYTITNLPITAQSGLSWGSVDAGSTSSNFEGQTVYSYGPDGYADSGSIPLRLIIQPENPTESTVSASNFTMAAQPYDSVVQQNPLNGFTWLPGSGGYNSPPPPWPLPVNIERVEFWDSGTPGQPGNTVVVYAWLRPEFTVTYEDTEITLDIDGDVDPIPDNPQDPPSFSLQCAETVVTGLEGWTLSWENLPSTDTITFNIFNDCLECFSNPNEASGLWDTGINIESQTIGQLPNSSAMIFQVIEAVPGTPGEDNISNSGCYTITVDPYTVGGLATGSPSCTICTGQGDSGGAIIGCMDDGTGDNVPALWPGIPATNYDSNAEYHLQSMCDYPVEDGDCLCDDFYEFNSWSDPACCEDDEPVDIFGCMTPDAVNYNPLATVDDGSCLGEVINEGYGGLKITVVTDSNSKLQVCSAVGMQWWTATNIPYYYNGMDIGAYPLNCMGGVIATIDWIESLNSSWECLTAPTDNYTSTYNTYPSYSVNGVVSGCEFEGMTIQTHEGVAQTLNEPLAPGNLPHLIADQGNCYGDGGYIAGTSTSININWEGYGTQYFNPYFSQTAGGQGPELPDGLSDVPPAPEPYTGGVLSPGDPLNPDFDYYAWGQDYYTWNTYGGGPGDIIGTNRYSNFSSSSIGRDCDTVTLTFYPDLAGGASTGNMYSYLENKVLFYIMPAPQHSVSRHNLWVDTPSAYNSDNYNSQSSTGYPDSGVPSNLVTDHKDIQLSYGTEQTTAQALGVVSFPSGGYSGGYAFSGSNEALYDFVTFMQSNNLHKPIVPTCAGVLGANFPYTYAIDNYPNEYGAIKRHQGTTKFNLTFPLVNVDGELKQLMGRDLITGDFWYGDGLPHKTGNVYEDNYAKDNITTDPVTGSSDYQVCLGNIKFTDMMPINLDPIENPSGDTSTPLGDAVYPNAGGMVFGTAPGAAADAITNEYGMPQANTGYWPSNSFPENNICNSSSLCSDAATVASNMMDWAVPNYGVDPTAYDGNFVKVTLPGLAGLKIDNSFGYKHMIIRVRGEAMKCPDCGDVYEFNENITIENPSNS